MSGQTDHEDTIRWRWRKIKTKNLAAASRADDQYQPVASCRRRGQETDAARPREQQELLAQVDCACLRVISEMPIGGSPALESSGRRRERSPQDSSQEARNGGKTSPAEMTTRRPAWAPTSAAPRTAPPAVQLINCSTILSVCLMSLILFNWLPPIASAPQAPLVPYEFAMGGSQPMGTTTAAAESLGTLASVAPSNSQPNATSTTPVASSNSSIQASEPDDHDLLFQLLKSTGSVTAANKLLENLLSQDQMMQQGRELAALGNAAGARQLPSHLEWLSVEQADYNQVRPSLGSSQEPTHSSTGPSSSLSSPSAPGNQIFAMPDRVAAGSNEAPIRVYVHSGLPEGAGLTLMKAIEPNTTLSTTNTSGSPHAGGLLDEIIAASASRSAGSSQANRNVHYDDEPAPGSLASGTLPVSEKRARDLLESSKLAENIRLAAGARAQPTNASLLAEPGAAGELKTAASGNGQPASAVDYDGLNNNESISSLLIRAGGAPRQLIANYSHLINHELPQGAHKRTQAVLTPAMGANSAQWQAIGDSRPNTPALWPDELLGTKATTTTIAPTTERPEKNSSDPAQVDRVRPNRIAEEHDEESIDSLASRHELTRVKQAGRLSEPTMASNSREQNSSVASELSHVNNLRDDTEKIRLNKKNETGLHRVVFINSMPQWTPARTRTTLKAPTGSEEAITRTTPKAQATPEASGSSPPVDMQSVSVGEFQALKSQVHSIEPHEAASTTEATLSDSPVSSRATKKPRRMARLTTAAGKLQTTDGQQSSNSNNKRSRGSKNAKQSAKAKKSKQTRRKMALLSTTRFPSLDGSLSTSGGLTDGPNEMQSFTRALPTKGSAEEIVSTTQMPIATREEAKVSRAAKSLNLARLFLGTTSVDPTQFMAHGSSALPLLVSEYSPSDEPQIFLSTSKAARVPSTEPEGLRVLPNDVLAPTPDSLAVPEDETSATTRHFQVGTTKQNKGPGGKWHAVELPLREHRGQSTSSKSVNRRAQKQPQTAQQTTPMAPSISRLISRATDDANSLLQQLKSLSNTRVVLRSARNKTRTANRGPQATQMASSTETYNDFGQASSSTKPPERVNQTQALDSIRRSTVTTSTSSPLADASAEITTPTDYSDAQSAFPSTVAFDASSTAIDLNARQQPLPQRQSSQEKISPTGGVSRVHELDLETTMAGAQPPATPRPVGARNQPISQPVRLIDQLPAPGAASTNLTSANIYGKRLPGDRSSHQLERLNNQQQQQQQQQQQLFATTTSTTRTEIEPSPGSQESVADQSSGQAVRGDESLAPGPPRAHERNSWSPTSSLPPTPLASESGRRTPDPLSHGDGATSPSPAASVKQTLGPLVYATPPSRTTFSPSTGASENSGTDAFSGAATSSTPLGLLEDPLPSILFHNRLSSLFKYKLANRTASTSAWSSASIADAFDFLSAEKAAAAGLAYPPIKYHEVPANGRQLADSSQTISNVRKSSDTTSMPSSTPSPSDPRDSRLRNLGFYGSFYDRSTGQQGQKETAIRDQNNGVIGGLMSSVDDKESAAVRDQTTNANRVLLRREKDERGEPPGASSSRELRQQDATTASIDLSTVTEVPPEQQSFAQLKNRSTAFDVQTSAMPLLGKQRQFLWPTTTVGLDLTGTALSNEHKRIQFGPSSTSMKPATSASFSDESAPASNEEQADLNVYVKPIASDERPSNNRWRLLTDSLSPSPDQQLAATSRRPMLKRVEMRKRRREPPILPSTSTSISTALASPEVSTFTSTSTTATSPRPRSSLSEVGTPPPSSAFSLETTRASQISDVSSSPSSDSGLIENHEQPITSTTLFMDQQLNDSSIDDNSLGNLFARLPQAYANLRANMSRPQLMAELIQTQPRTSPSGFIEAATTVVPDYLASPSSEVPINYIMPPSLNQSDAGRQQANMEEALQVDGSQDWRSSSLGPLVSDFRTKSILRTMINLGVPNNGANLLTNSSSLLGAARKQHPELVRVVKVNKLRRQQSTTSIPITTISSASSTRSPTTSSTPTLETAGPQARAGSSLRPVRRNQAGSHDRLHRQPFLPPKLIFQAASSSTGSSKAIEELDRATSTLAPSTTTTSTTTTSTTTTSSTTTTTSTTTSTTTTPAPPIEQTAPVRIEPMTSGPNMRTPSLFDTSTVSATKSPPIIGTSIQTITGDSDIRTSNSPTSPTTFFNPSSSSTTTTSTSRPALQTKRPQSIFELADEQEMLDANLQTSGTGQVRNQRHQPTQVFMNDLKPILTMRDQLPGDRTLNSMPTSDIAAKPQHLSPLQKAAIVTIGICSSLIVSCLLIAALTIKCGKILSRSPRQNPRSPTWVGPTRRRAPARKGHLMKNTTLIGGVRSRSASRLVQKEPARSTNSKIVAPKRRSKSSGPLLRNQLLENSSAESSVESLCLSTPSQVMNFVPNECQPSRVSQPRAVQREPCKTRHPADRSIGQRITGTLTSRLLRLHLPRLVPQFAFDNSQQQQQQQHSAQHLQYGTGASTKPSHLQLDPVVMMNQQRSKGHTKQDNQYANFHLVAKHQKQHHENHEAYQPQPAARQMFSANLVKCSSHLNQQGVHGDQSACNCANCLYAWSSSSSTQDNMAGARNGAHQARVKQLPFGAGSSVLRHASEESACHMLDTSSKAPIPPVRTHSRGVRQENVDQASVQHSQMDNEHHLLIDGEVSRSANLPYSRPDGHMSALESRLLAVGNSSRPPVSSQQRGRNHYHQHKPHQASFEPVGITGKLLPTARDESEPTTSDELTESENQYDLHKTSDGRKTLGSNCRCNILMYPL